ncbi:hypothetical protein VE03_09895 [Pseudogymnoascus sp. 23342-1-I1]|nr:hypothetical protein VE03_09895 [Pseudogymnoascus sp. 23342-1-I1]
MSWLEHEGYFSVGSCRAEPRLGMKGGLFLRIANRRRIWTASCTKLADKFCSKLPPHLRAASSENAPLNFREVLLFKATWSQRYVVTHNKETRLYSKVQKCFWVDEWEDTYEKSQTVEAFFMRSNGFLVGIALTTEGGKRQMVGSKSDNAIKFEAVIPVDDWICGMVVHIPNIQLAGRPVGSIRETSPKGITIICKSGRDFILVRRTGDILYEYWWLAQAIKLLGWWLKWLKADIPSLTFTRLGLITLCNEELHDGCLLCDDIVRRRHSRIDEIMWKDDGSRLFGIPYWNNPSIRILHRDDVGKLGIIYDSDLKLRRLKSVSIFTTYSHMEDISGVEVESYRICGLGVDFSAEHTESRRIVGVEGKPAVDDREAGLTTLHGPPISIALFRTNRGRDVGCSTAPNGCYSGSDAPEWLSIKAPPNRTIVGIITTFANGHGGGGRGTYKQLVSIAALSMPLGIEGEIVESDDEDYEVGEEEDEGETGEEDEEPAGEINDEN